MITITRSDYMENSSDLHNLYYGQFVNDGIENLVVVQSNNAILVCPKDRAQDVKNIVAYLKSIHRTELT